MLSIDNVSAAKGSTTLIENLSFTVMEGSYTELHGANGCGKTTLLEIIAGFENPVRGDVKWCGEPVKNLWEDYRVSVLYVGHENALKPNLPVIQSLKLWSELEDAELALFATIEALNLHDLLDLPAKNLSAGQKRRIALARLFLGRRLIWLLDEPFTNLDDYFSDIIKTAIASKVASGGIVISALHQNSGIKGMQKINLHDYGPIHNE